MTTALSKCSVFLTGVDFIILILTYFIESLSLPLPPRPPFTPPPAASLGPLQAELSQQKKALRSKKALPGAKKRSRGQKKVLPGAPERSTFAEHFFFA